MSVSAMAGERRAGGVTGFPRKICALLDRIYLYAGYLAAASLCMIMILTMLQIVGRYAGYNIRGLTDYAGYFMAASAFLAFAHTLNKGAHIRIELFISLLGRGRKYAEWLCFVAATAIASWFAYYCCDMVYWSYTLGDMSQGQDATPLWIPQLSMAFGAVLLAMALADHTLRLLFLGDHGIAPSVDVT